MSVKLRLSAWGRGQLMQMNPSGLVFGRRRWGGVPLSAKRLLAFWWQDDPQQDVSASHAPCRGRATPRDSERVGLGEAKGAVTE